MLVPHLFKIYFGLGWPSSVLEIVSVTKIKMKHNNHQNQSNKIFKKHKKKIEIFSKSNFLSNEKYYMIVYSVLCKQ